MICVMPKKKQTKKQPFTNVINIIIVVIIVFFVRFDIIVLCDGHFFV